ncbi:hypothetical protein GGP41_008388 [Bipolaris sorokiniana]|uniref:Uncharacterized protein n=2 Tax=Cochliobolus sativus TaxID=45130 RepID=A0A8H5ZAU1_COCSA|nr:hypothetical protein GGP41_008388 [Bipolaris sorokiniana]
MAFLRASPKLAKSRLPTNPAFNALQQVREKAGSATVRARPYQHPTPPSPKPEQLAQNPSLPSINLVHHLREARPVVRYTVYASLGLMATVESTFWFHVLRAKFFPRATQADRQQDDELLDRLKSAMAGFRQVWMGNYQRYYGAHLRGLGYGGLDSL